MIITDKQGKVYHEERWTINETFFNRRLMTGSDFLKPAKLAMYDREIHPKAGTNFAEVKARVNYLLNSYEVDIVAAYNVAFDFRALSATCSTYLGTTEFFQQERPILCLWNMACDTIMQQKTFIRQARKYGWLTESGKNISTNAETAYRYLSNQPDYIEPHTALEDCRIEVAIMAYCFRQRKATAYGVKHGCWRKVQKTA